MEKRAEPELSGNAQVTADPSQPGKGLFLSVEGVERMPHTSKNGHSNGHNGAPLPDPSVPRQMKGAQMVWEALVR